MIRFRRRQFLLATGALLAVPLGAAAQRSDGSVRLGYLWIGPPDSDRLTLRGIRQGLIDVGLVEGRNLRIDARYADSRPERLPGLAKELVEIGVTVLLVPGAVATRAARAATATIPIISASADPVASGFARSLARPGGNITGMAVMAGDRMVGKWIELLKESVPVLKRAALIYNPDNPSNVAMLEVARQVGRKMGVEVASVPLAHIDGVGVALSAVEKTGADGMIVSDDALLLTSSKQLVAFAAKRRLPAIYGQREYAEAGGLMTYASNIFEVWRRAGAYVKRISEGARPAELPIEQPTKFELVVNLRIAKALGITIPQSVLLRAEEVIE